MEWDSADNDKVKMIHCDKVKEIHLVIGGVTEGVRRTTEVTPPKVG